MAKRYFSMKFVREEEIIVAVETDETGDITERLELPDKVGQSWFMDDWPRFDYDPERTDEVTEDFAATAYEPGGLREVPIAKLKPEEECERCPTCGETFAECGHHACEEGS